MPLNAWNITRRRQPIQLRMVPVPIPATPLTGLMVARRHLPRRGQVIQLRMVQLPISATPLTGLMLRGAHPVRRGRMMVVSVVSVQQVPTIVVRPTALQVGRSALQRITLMLPNAGWTGETTFTLSGMSGVTLISTIVNGSGLAVLAVTTTTATGSGVLTVTDGFNRGSTAVLPLRPPRNKWFAGLNRGKHY